MSYKLLKDLTPDDLLTHKVWKHWYENEIELVAPTDLEEIPMNSDQGYIVLTEFTLNNKRKFLGFCSPGDSSGLDYIQPVLFTDKDQVELYKENGWTEIDKSNAFEKIGFASVDVFPIVYISKVKCGNQYYQGNLLDFNVGD